MNRNPGTSGFSIMNQELKDSACQRMAENLDVCGAKQAHAHI
jgi:hypothetical protein